MDQQFITWTQESREDEEAAQASVSNRLVGYVQRYSESMGLSSACMEAFQKGCWCRGDTIEGWFARPAVCRKARGGGVQKGGNREGQFELNPAKETTRSTNTKLDECSCESSSQSRKHSMTAICRLAL